MNLLIDMGNTRLKWATADDLDIGQGTAFSNTEISTDSLTSLWRPLSRPERIAIACVSAHRLYEVVLSAINTCWPGVPIVKAVALAEALGVRNAYPEPAKLGVDRWLGLTAGYHAWQGPLCIVGCGTAITVDVITAAGQHLGGLISPGLGLMKEALAQGTASLRPSAAPFPCGLANFTEAAIYNGTLAAATGFIEHALKDQPGNLQLVLTGGDAETIASRLSLPAQVVPDLVLRGLALSLQQP
jgi:type III pantothenate kinase